MVGMAQYLLSVNVRRYDSRFYRAAGLSVNRQTRHWDPHLFLFAQRLFIGGQHVLEQVSNREVRSGARSAALLSKIAAWAFAVPRAVHHPPLDQTNLHSDATGFNICGLVAQNAVVSVIDLVFPSIRPVNNIP